MTKEKKIECWANVYDVDDVDGGFDMTYRDYFHTLDAAEHYEEEGMLRRVHFREVDE
tara:strand:+ start:329 stop:499 length:171 start_codon:yes stop_codon:yes gene_type:complete